jgi:hypothetical protein
MKRTNLHIGEMVLYVTFRSYHLKLSTDRTLINYLVNGLKNNYGLEIYINLESNTEA